jgi:serine/threonine-protein kinase
VSIAPGTRLGQYEVQDFIGQGAMGLVYRAYHSQLERTGAVKVLQAIAPDPDTTSRFRHEAQAIAQLRHPNILNVYDFGEYQGTPYMIVEYVPGGSLGGRLSKGQLDMPTTLKYLRGIAAGLDHAHNHGIVHRDVKPANVLLEQDDTPVIADFGLAKLMQGSSLKSMTGVTTGTPAYMAPEQVTGSHVGPAADRYSLATMAYEMLTGVIPFDGEGLMEILYAQVHREPPPPSARNSALGPHVDEVILRGLAKDPALRWESCTAFVDALAAAVDGKKPVKQAAARTMVIVDPALAPTVPLGTAAAATAAAYPAGQADLMEPIHPMSSPPVTKRKSRKGLIAAVAGAVIVLLLLAASVGYLVTHQKPTVSLSESTVRAGDTVVVTASHVPANQAGEIQLRSTLHSFPFQADGNGELSDPILVPKNIGSGDHTVQICWAGQCYATATLHVIDSIGSSPSPTSSPTTTPSPTASPTARPTPSPAPRSLTLSPTHIVVKTGSMTVKGFNFSPGKVATVTFIQAGTTSKTVGTPTVGGDGTFLLTYTVPSTAVVGPASIRACDINGCAYASFQVTSS